MPTIFVRSRDIHRRLPRAASATAFECAHLNAESGRADILVALGNLRAQSPAFRGSITARAQAVADEAAQQGSGGPLRFATPFLTADVPNAAVAMTRVSVRAA